MMPHFGSLRGLAALVLVWGVCACTAPGESGKGPAGSGSGKGDWGDPTDTDEFCDRGRAMGGSCETTCNADRSGELCGSTAEIQPLENGVALITPTHVMEVTAEADEAGSAVTFRLDGAEVMSVPAMAAPDELSSQEGDVVLDFTRAETYERSRQALLPVAEEVHAAKEAGNLRGPMLASNDDAWWLVCVTEEVVESLKPPEHSAAAVPFWAANMAALGYSSVQGGTTGALVGFLVGGPWGAVFGGTVGAVGTPVLVQTGIVALESDC